MTVESATYLDALSASNPPGTDPIPEGDDHLRLIKAVLKATFPGRGGADRRAALKSSGYIPAIPEVGVVFVHTATLTVSLPALSGLPDGTFYTFKVRTGTTTLTPNGADTIDLLTGFVLTAGQSCDVVKQGINWEVLLSSVSSGGGGGGETVTWDTLTGKPTSPNITGTWAWSANVSQPYYVWGSNDGVNHQIWNPANFSVNYAATANYANSAGSASSAASATTATSLQGYTPANFASAGHTHSTYAPLTALVNAVRGESYIRFTRADGSTFDVTI